MTTLIIIGSIILAIMLGLLVFMFTIKFDNEHDASKKSLHAKIYNILSCTNELPSNICSYFWNYLMAIISIPFTFFIIIWNLFKPIKSINAFDTFSRGFALMWIGLALFDLVLFTICEGVVALLIGLGIVIGVVVITVLIAGLIFVLIDYFNNRSNKPYKSNKTIKVHQTPLVIKRIKDWKNKNCSIINWK